MYTMCVQQRIIFVEHRLRHRRLEHGLLEMARRSMAPILQNFQPKICV